MYCKQCGAEMSDGIQNCLLCGAKMESPEDMAPDDTVIVDHEEGATELKSYEDVFAPFMDRDTGDMLGLDAYEQTSENHTSFDGEDSLELYAEENEITRDVDVRRSRGRGRQKNRVLIIAACVLALVAVLCVTMFIILPGKSDNGQAEEAARAVTPAPAATPEAPKVAVVTIPLKVPELNDEGSRIPVRIEGTTANGSAHQTELFASAEGVTTQLATGTYQAHVIETPISGQGVMYRIPDSDIKIVVDNDGAVTLSPQNGSFELVPVEAAEQTDEAIERARQWIAKDPERSDKADELAKRARTRREDARKESESPADAQYSSPSDSQRSYATDDTSAPDDTYTTDDTYEQEDDSVDVSVPQTPQQEEPQGEQSQSQDQQQPSTTDDAQTSEQDASGQQSTVDDVQSGNNTDSGSDTSGAENPTVVSAESSSLGNMCCVWG